MIAFNPKTVPSVFGLLLVLALHACVVTLLLSDKISVAFLPTTKLVTARIIYEPHISTQPVRLHVNLSLINPRIEPPEMPGIQVAEPVHTIDMPLVKIGARFESGLTPEIPVKEIQSFQQQPNTARTVGLSVQIYEDGSIGEVLVEHSSDSVELDRYLTHYAKQHWRFMPALEDGRPVSSWKAIDIIFSANAITVTSR